MDAETEIAFVNTFIVKERRERYLYMLSSTKRRSRVLAQLYHCTDIDLACVEPESSSGMSVESLLREAGAPNACYVISTDNTHDGMMLQLDEVLAEYVAGNAMLISCIPGHLGCFVDEYGTATILKH